MDYSNYYKVLCVFLVGFIWGGQEKCNSADKIYISALSADLICSHADFDKISTGPLRTDEEKFSEKLYIVAERVADLFLEGLIPEFPKRNPYLTHVYSLDLGLEALLELSEVTGETKWKDAVFQIIDQRRITPSTLLPYQSQPFATINFAMFKATGDYAWLPVFVRESEIWRKDVRRSPEGAVLMYSRGNTDLYFLVIDHIQEYASRMARCGKHTGDRTYLAAKWNVAHLIASLTG